MTRPSFVAIAPRDAASTARWRDRVSSLISRERDLALVFDCDGLLIAGKKIDQRPIGADGGVVLGAVFPKAPAGPRAISPLAATTIRRTGGAELFHSFWGNYVAFVRRESGEGFDVLRSPFGDLPCLFLETDDSLILASDAPRLLAWSGSPRRVDWTAVARFLLAEDIVHEQTCLTGVCELRGGSRLSLDGARVAAEQVWSPWHHVQRAAGEESASDRLRSAIVDVVGRVTNSVGTPLLRLSGGLDSSIVAAALAANGGAFSALNMMTNNPSGDERVFARAVAQHLSLPMIERVRQVSQIDVTRSEGRDFARPAARCFTQASGALSAEAAAELGATVVVDGGGGDQVFCSLRSARMVVDCLLNKPRRGPLLQTVMALARLTQTSVWGVARRSWSVSRRTSPRFDYLADTRFLAPDVWELGADATAHPWLSPPSNALPGKAAHIAMLVQAQTIVHGANAAPTIPLLSPLLSQPVIELCLGVPSWAWVKGGRDRAVARDGFASLLPPPVTDRRTKGTPDSFLFEIVADNRATIRDMLAGGNLVAAGLLDRTELLDAIDTARPISGQECYRLMRLVDVEAWSRAA